MTFWVLLKHKNPYSSATIRPSGRRRFQDAFNFTVTKLPCWVLKGEYASPSFGCLSTSLYMQYCPGLQWPDFVCTYYNAFPIIHQFSHSFSFRLEDIRGQGWFFFFVDSGVQTSFSPSRQKVSTDGLLTCGANANTFFFKAAETQCVGVNSRCGRIRCS